ncbi:MAG: PKD domain-containing protein [Patescibacteria group bacterium]
MENTPNTTKINTAVTTAPVAAPQTPAAPVQAPAATTQTQIATSVARQASAPSKPGVDQGTRNKKFVIGCCSAAGCGGLLFLFIVIAYLATGGSPDNPIFQQFGVSGRQVLDVLILLTNLMFGVLTFVSFVVGIVGIFKIATTKKADLDNRKKGMYVAFISFAAMFLLIFSWIFAYLFLSSKQTPVVEEVIITEPVETIGLTAPATIAFDASQIPINGNRFEVLTYVWDFDDGDQATGIKQTHTYQSKGRNAGKFEAKVTISAREKTTGEEFEQIFTKVVTISNQSAEAVISAKPERGESPLLVEFDASKSTDVDGAIQEFSWDFDDDGIFDASGPTAEHTFEEPGKYTAILKITESSGHFSTFETPIEATTSKAPKVIIDITNTESASLTIGTEYTFSGARSTSPGGRIETFEWDFGDDSAKKTTRTASHAFKLAGTYEVILSVRDETGRTGEGAKIVTVGNAPSVPQAVITTTPVSTGGKLTGTAPLEISFDSSASTDADDDIVEYSWDFDGDGETDSSDESESFTFTSAGTYNTKLTLEDSAGNKDTGTLEVTVAPPGLSAEVSANPTDGEVPLTVSFDASGSRYPGHRIVAYEWDFGDGTEQRLDTASISHQYTRTGSFTASVTAVADDGKRAETSVNINVRPVALQACFTATPESGTAPLDVDFDPGCSSGTIGNYKWTFGAAGTSRDRKPRKTFTQPGTYEVILEVSDNQNTLARFTKTVTVTGE